MRLVIIGFGYSARAIAAKLPRLESRVVTVRTPEKAEQLRAQGFNALVFDGTTLSDDLAGALKAATHLLLCAPPDAAGDPLLKAGSATLLTARHLQRIGYLSTVGVYGDYQGGWVDETCALRPTSLRSRQRVAAEEAWQGLAAQKGIDLGIFRLSGIYGPGRSAIDNLREGTARRIIKPGQVFNRIHVADIGAAVARALLHEGELGVFNLTDDEPAPPQDVVAYAAGLMNLPCPPDIPFEDSALSPMGRSFYGENKRVSNARLKAVLSYTLHYPTYREGMAGILAAQT
jgi:nucleoside-diphosphate-sugar epimerase